MAERRSTRTPFIAVWGREVCCLPLMLAFHSPEDARITAGSTQDPRSTRTPNIAVWGREACCFAVDVDVLQP